MHRWQPASFSMATFSPSQWMDSFQLKTDCTFLFPKNVLGQFAVPCKQSHGLLRVWKGTGWHLSVLKELLFICAAPLATPFWGISALRTSSCQVSALWIASCPTESLGQFTKLFRLEPLLGCWITQQYPATYKQIHISPNMCILLFKQPCSLRNTSYERCQSPQKGQESKLKKWIGQGSQMLFQSIFIRFWHLVIISWQKADCPQSN